MAIVQIYREWAEEEFFKANSEKGSVTVLTLGLFLLVLSAILLITDLSSLTVAKSSLTHITEIAAQRATHEVDESRYYSGSSLLPIDCPTALARVLRELENRQETGSFSRPEILSVVLSNFVCDGTSLEVHTKSEIRLPFKLPFADSQNFEIQAMAVAQNLIDLKSSQ
jgi:hypothetical protein